MKILASIILLSFIATGCSSVRVSDLKDNKTTQNISELPKWILEPDMPNGVAAVGIASPSAGGIKFQIPKAEMDARANIAVAVQSEITRVTKDALREAKVNQVNDVEQVFTQATKEVVKNMPMSAAKRINIYQAADGTLYVHMILKNDDYGQYLENSQKLYEKRLRQSNLSRDNIDKSQIAVKELFDELENERKE
jgi:hypothetical protein